MIAACCDTHELQGKGLFGRNPEASNVLHGMGKCRDFNFTGLCGQNAETSNVLDYVGKIQRLQKC